MQIVAYLNFDGDCAEAFRLLRVDARRRAADADPGRIADGRSGRCGSRDRILHARLEVGDALLMGSDSPVNGHERPQGFAVSITVDDPAEADRIFKRSRGRVGTMPMGETFWAARFGMLTDRFGTPWNRRTTIGRTSG